MMDTLMLIIVVSLGLWAYFQHTPLSPCPHKENRLCSHRRNPDGTCPIKDECLGVQKEESQTE